jgi:signal peptidase complex subunit 3
MYSTLARLNALSSLLSSCVMALLGLIALSSLVFPVGHVDDSSVVINSVQVYVPFSWIVDVDADDSDVELNRVHAGITPEDKSSHLLNLTSVLVRPPSAFFFFLPDETIVDLTPLFHWNTKQVFVYLNAEYMNAKGVSIRWHTHNVR